MFDYEETTRETVIDGIKLHYDACSGGDLESAKEFYKNAFDYIGTSKSMIINGVTQNSTVDYHFFIYKNK